MTEFFAPPQYGGNRERGLERWKEAIRLFEAEAKSQGSAQAVAWGHAEAWAWLGGAYLMIGRPDDARAALEQAIRLRPDFWWAAQIALPQGAAFLPMCLGGALIALFSLEHIVRPRPATPYGE